MSANINIRRITEKPSKRISKRAKSLNDIPLSLSSNSLSLKIYPEKEIRIHIDRHIYPLYITNLYRGIKLYQGTKYPIPVNKTNIQEYYNYYNRDIMVHIS